MSEKKFTATREKTPDGVRFIVKGWLDSSYADELQLKLEEALKDGQINIILNMSDVEYLCSNGIRVILKTYKDAKEASGKLRIEEPSESVRKILTLTALDKMLTE